MMESYTLPQLRFAASLSAARPVGRGRFYHRIQGGEETTGLTKQLHRVCQPLTRPPAKQSDVQGQSVPA